MAKFNSSSLALLAILLASLLAAFTVEAAAIKTTAPAAPKSTPKSKVPSFTVYAKSGLAGNSKLVKNYGCSNHNLGTVGSVKYAGGPIAQITFFAGKNCTGKVTHQMDTSTIKSMGGPYKSNSVKVFK
ncbi:hypothetical protein EDD21DRAFT_380217 [Dissophora ornata]|nr:hypothetical protein BGZ58_007923 [Dissophora ornata]KAI8599301.1 hypothetical protein EDD21DRAFT_380217 [Dissophora ornata]